MSGVANGSVKMLAWESDYFPKIGLPAKNEYPPLKEINRKAAELFAKSLLGSSSGFEKGEENSNIQIYRIYDGSADGVSISVSDARAMVNYCQSVEILPMGLHVGDRNAEDALAAYQCTYLDGSKGLVQAGLVVSSGRVKQVFIGPQPKTVYRIPSSNNPTVKP